MPSLTVLSPHQDDAALSLAMTIRTAARLGHPVRIINCFTISTYAPHGQARSAAEVGRLRTGEDREFASRAGAGIEMVDLGMEDAPLRLECPVTEVRRRKVSWRELADATRIAAEVQRAADGIVLAPLGLGNHIDHLVALEAGLQLSESGTPVAFYEDLPYAAELRECCIVRAADFASLRTGERLRAALMQDGEAASRKRFAIEAYASQLSPSQMDSVIGYGELRGRAERLWIRNGSESRIPAPLQRLDLEAGSPAAAMRRRLQCATHTAASRAASLRRHVAQLSLRGGGVNAPQAS